MPHPLREQARELRRQGLSYREINTKLGIAKSTLAYMLRDIELTDVQKARLEARSRMRAKEVLANFTPEQRQVWGRRGGVECQARHGARLRLLRIQRGNKYTQKTQCLLEEKVNMFEILGVCKGGGYHYCYTDPPHPNANSSGLYPLHRVLVENFIGRLLRSEEVVHHKDGDKNNNVLENLVVLSASEHARLHYRKDRLG